MMARAKYILLTFAIGFCFCLSGCSLNNFRVEAAQVSQIVLPILSDPKTFNYALNQEFPNVFMFTYEGLTKQNAVTAELEPALAESWEISEDKTRIIFTLREGLKWSDGQPLTADDVVFTYQDIVFNKEIPSDGGDGLKIGEKGEFPNVKKLDDRRVEFILPEPFAPFLQTASGPSSNIAILPKHALEASVKERNSEGKLRFSSTWGVDTDPQKIIVNGPYQLESYRTGERVIFRRNPYYWRKDSQGNQLPYVERIVMQIVESTTTGLLQFRSGGLDMAEGWGRLPPEDFPLLKREEKRGKFRIYVSGPRSGTTFISFNLNTGKRKGKPLVNPIKSKWFNTVKFRQAVAYALDRQAMINNVLRGLGETQNSPISVQSPFYISPQEGLKVYDYNPEKSKQLLKEAGFQYNSQNQLLDAEGNRVRFTLMTNAENRTRVSMGAQIKQDLSHIGIQVDFVPIAFNTLVAKLTNTLDWDCYLLGFTGGTEPHDGANTWLPDGGLHSFNQKPLDKDNPLEGRTVADWEAEIGKLYIQGAQELDPVKRKEIYAKTQELAQEYLPMIYLVNPLSMAPVRDRISGIKYSSLSGAVWNIYELQVKD